MQTEEKNKTNQGFAPETGDMPKEDFRRFGYELVDWIADYFERMENLPVLSNIEPGWLKNNLPDSAPERGEDFADVFADVEKLILPSVTHWNHPNFHGLFSTSTSFSRHFRRDAFRRVRYESDALAHVARFDRTRTRRSGLASENDESARRF